MTARFIPGFQLPAGDGPAPRYVSVQGDRVLVLREGGRARFAAEPPDGVHHPLATLSDTPWVAVDVNEAVDIGDLQPVDLRELFGLVSELEWSLAGRAVQIVAWDHQHRFCGRCATPT